MISDRDNLGKVTGTSIIDRDNPESFILIITYNHEVTTSIPTFPI